MKRIIWFFFVIFLASFSFSYTIGPNYHNISVDTRVNITNAGPEILSVKLDDSITLVAGGTKTVYCNVSAMDYNGYNDIDNLNATLFYSSVLLNDSDDNNTHYTNPNCTRVSQNGYYANYTCGFDVYYYAINGTWNCTARINDSYSFTYINSNTTLINALYALNVTSLIDYGDLAIEDTSANKSVNMTNFGNVPINISVYGYGATPGDGLALDCAVGNITIDNEKFSANVSANYSQKISLSSSSQQINGLIIQKQTVADTYVTNVSYWQLYVPPNPFGVCNGTVVFQAETAN